MLLAEDPKLWVTTVAPTGALKSWVESNQKTSIGSYISNEVRSTLPNLMVVLKHVFTIVGITNTEGYTPQGGPGRPGLLV
jgi:hypothetical protein